MTGAEPYYVSWLVLPVTCLTLNSLQSLMVVRKTHNQANNVNKTHISLISEQNVGTLMLLHKQALAIVL